MLESGDNTERDFASDLKQVLGWHRQLQEAQVAHKQQAVRCGHYRRAFGVSAAILATFTGASWASDLSTAGAPSTVLRWVAAIAGLLGGVFVAVNTTMDWLKRAEEHQAASARYGKLRLAIEGWDVEHTAGARPADREIKAWLHGWAAADATSPLLPDHVSRRAKTKAPSGAGDACKSLHVPTAPVRGARITGSAPAR